MMKKVRNPHFYFIFLLFNSCANIVTPGGGIKDSTSPVPLRYTPGNNSINYRDRSFNVSFNEYIQLKDLDNQLIISPPLKEAPDVEVRKKNLRVHWKDSLPDNTTYNFNFGGSVADLNEGNVLENFKYTFSTGSYIDSLSVRGSVYSAFERIPQPGTLVMLYGETSDDSVFSRGRPLYFSKTNAEGDFVINNLKPGRFRITALKDMNSNYHYDQPGESIAFGDNLINSTDTNRLHLLLFQELKEPQRILKTYQEYPGKINIIFHHAVEMAAVHPLYASGKKGWELRELSAGKDTLIYWYTDLYADTLALEVLYSSGMRDTVRVPIKAKAEKSGRRGEASNKPAVKSNTAGFLDLNTPLFLTASNPLKEYDRKKIILYADSIPAEGMELKSEDPALRNISVLYPWKENTSYRLLLLPSAMENIFGQQNDTLQISFRTRALSDYGSINLKIRGKEGPRLPYILQMVSDPGGPAAREYVVKGDTSIGVTYLLPGKYMLKLIEDKNGNGKWDTGDYYSHKQPEKVICYPDKVTIRANWDMDLLWEIPGDK